MNRTRNRQVTRAVHGGTLRCNRNVIEGKTFRGNGESRSFRLGSFRKIEIDLGVRRGVVLRMLVTILMSVGLISELQDKAWSRMDDCDGDLYLYVGRFGCGR